MDWEYQFQPPVDHSSPFAKFSQKPPTCKFLSQPCRDRGESLLTPLPCACTSLSSAVEAFLRLQNSIITVIKPSRIGNYGAY
jgi:hypothetical protein